MKIINRNLVQNQQILPYQKRKSDKKTNIEHQQELFNYSRISFGAIAGVKKKKTDIEAEKSKLLRKLNETLVTAPVELSPIEKLTKTLLWYRNREEKHKIFNERLEEIYNDSTISKQVKIKQLLALKAEYEVFSKQKPTFFNKPKTPKLDEKTDLQLANKFKSAIIEDNFNLEKIYNEYYQDLNNIQTVKELKKKYPKITIPQKPENKIAQAIVTNLTKDFYVDLYELI